MTDALFESALTTAPMLLGATLTHTTPGGPVSGIIVETEAYTQDDPASHTFRGETMRNAAMFKSGGTIYIYFTYGMHYCMNFVCGPKGTGEGVLIRALEPVLGIDIMKRNRITDDVRNLTNGPAKLVQALEINKSYNETTLTNSKISLKLPEASPEWIQTTRIGIRQGIDLPRRFYIKDSSYIFAK